MGRGYSHLKTGTGGPVSISGVWQLGGADVGQGPQFLHTGGPTTGLSVLRTWWLASFRASDPRERARWKLTVFWTYTWKSHSITSATSCSLEMSDQVHPLLRGAGFGFPSERSVEGFMNLSQMYFYPHFCDVLIPESCSHRTVCNSKTVRIIIPSSPLYPSPHKSLSLRP